VWVRCEFYIAFVFDCADRFGDWHNDWDWVEVACFDDALCLLLNFSHEVRDGYAHLFAFLCW
jgi:hypothetical protein